MNINHCEEANDLLSQIIRESNVDVGVFGESFRYYIIVRLAAWMRDAFRIILPLAARDNNPK